MRQEFLQAICQNQRAFQLDLAAEVLERLADYYELVQKDNALLHLVAPCSVEEFAVRHILESLTLLEYLPRNAKFADVGSGAGLPSIPCLLVRDDLSAIIIESKLKKARFLETAVQQLGLRPRAIVVDKQFEEAEIRSCRYVTCRALDKLTERLPRLLKWAKGKKLLLFGGPSLGQALKTLPDLRHTEVLTPMSDRRYLYVMEQKRSPGIK